VLLVGILFFMIGFLRGWATGNHDEGVVVIVSASFIQGLTALILLGVFSRVFHMTYMDRYGVLFALFGMDIESGGLGDTWFLGYILVPQILLGLIDVLIGGSVGKHYALKRPKLDARSQP
jgi:hypothetical protein